MRKRICAYIEWKHPVVTNYNMSASGCAPEAPLQLTKLICVPNRTLYLKRSRLTCTGKYPTFIRSFRAADDVLVNPIALRICDYIKNQTSKDGKLYNLATKAWSVFSVGVAPGQGRAHPQQGSRPL
jgi:hypothetical protein